MLSVLTGLGLSAAAGLNAYVPFLLVAVLARFTDVIALPASYAWIESWWSISAAGVLLLTELVLDKIPVVDHVNDAVATLIRPTVGGLIFSASTAAADVDASPWMQDNPWVGIVLGVVVAGIVHAGKSTARPVVNVGTAGLGTPIVSTAEDLTSVSIALLAVFAPVAIVLVLILLAVVLVLIARRVLRRRRELAARRPGVP